MNRVGLICMLLLSLAACGDDEPTAPVDAAMTTDGSSIPDAPGLLDSSADTSVGAPEAGAADAAAIEPVCTFEPIVVEEDTYLFSVGGAAEDEVWIGGNGKAYLFNGTSFSTEVGASRPLLDVATTATDSYFVTNVNGVGNGRVHRSTGSALESVYDNAENVLESLWASPSGQVWAAGEIAIRGSGESWEEIETNPDGLGASYFGAVAGRADDDVIVGTPLGFFRWTGGPYLESTDAALGAIVELGARAGTDYWAVTGRNAVYSSSDGENWTLLREYDALIRELAVDADNGVWIVVDGTDVDHFDGAGWARYDLSSLGPGANLTDIAVIGNDIWVVGKTGIAARCARE